MCPLSSAFFSSLSPGSRRTDGLHGWAGEARMRIAVPRETDGGEPRVAATPETIKKYKSLGAEVVVARGAGVASGIPDAEFEAAGAQIGDTVTKDADIVLKVRRPAQNELSDYKKGTLVIAIM